ncbi:hypothetical protein SETIT_8G109900v2 [Setaria italica]|uniref:Uncharacterized protein n=1 Tax=Setaria italica TaxID=4555 RepID=A0A368S6H5_SETIT|nr:hypothetical protein SETIT_8G109900v2 [Setaria italica]
MHLKEWRRWSGWCGHRQRVGVLECVRDRFEHLVEVAPEVRWCWCRRHRLHGDIGHHSFNGRRRFDDWWCRGVNNLWCRGFNSTWFDVAGADIVQAKVRRWWLALLMRIAWRRSRAATNRSPLAARICICMEATNYGLEKVAVAIVVANARPKALEDAAALSMVAAMVDWAAKNSTNISKGVEETTNEVRR